MRLASVQSEALASSVVVELMRPRSERMASAASFPSSMCRILAVRAASTWPSAARRRKVEALVCLSGGRLSSWARIRDACTCAHLWLLVLVVFFIHPIGASEVDPGCIDFKGGDQPIHNTLLRCLSFLLIR